MNIVSEALTPALAQFEEVVKDRLNSLQPGLAERVFSSTEWESGVEPGGLSDQLEFLIARPLVWAMRREGLQLRQAEAVLDGFIGRHKVGLFSREYGQLEAARKQQRRAVAA